MIYLLKSIIIDLSVEHKIDIETILKNSIEGKLVLNNFQRNQVLTNEHRIQIPDIILRNELKEENGFSCVKNNI